jgi:hypothetical protein
VVVWRLIPPQVTVFQNLLYHIHLMALDKTHHNGLNLSVAPNAKAGRAALKNSILIKPVFHIRIKVA